MPHFKPVDLIFTIKREELINPDGSITVTVTPPAFTKSSGKSVTLSPDQYRRYKEWREGSVLIQDALPDLLGTEREILLNGDPDV